MRAAAQTACTPPFARLALLRILRSTLLRAPGRAHAASSLYADLAADRAVSRVRCSNVNPAASLRAHSIHLRPVPAVLSSQRQELGSKYGIADSLGCLDMLCAGKFYLAQELALVRAAKAGMITAPRQKIMKKTRK